VIALDSAALWDSLPLPAWGDDRTHAHVTARLVRAPRAVARWGFWYMAPASDTILINLVQQGYAEHFEGLIRQDSLLVQVTYTLGDAPLPPRHDALHRASCAALPN